MTTFLLILVCTIIVFGAGVFIGFKWGTTALADVKKAIAAISTESTTLKSDVLALKKFL